MTVTKDQLGQLIYDDTVTTKPYLPGDTPEQIVLKVWKAVSGPLVDNFLQVDAAAGVNVQNSGVAVATAGTLNFAGAGVTSVVNSSGTVTITIAGSGGTISITTGNIVNGAVTLPKLANLSADRMIGRDSSGAGVPQEITVTAAGRALIDDADASAQRTTLGLGTLATQSGTFSGTSSGTNTGDQTNITGNAATVTTNANLTGPVTSVGNATTIADPNLAALSGLVSANDKIPYFTGAGTANVANFTQAARDLVDDPDAGTMRGTLGLGTLATQNGTFSGSSSGTNTGDQTITLTGDVTGTGTSSFVATIAANAVTNAKLATMADQTIKGNVSGGAAAPSDLSKAQLKTLADVSGTNTGDQTITLTGDVAGSGTGSFAATIAANAVTDAKLRQGTATSVVGRSANSTGNVSDIVSTTDGTSLVRAAGALTWKTTRATVTASVTHNVTFTFTNPVTSITPSGISVVKTTLGAKVTSWSYSAGTNVVTALVQYDPPPGVWVVRRSANQSLSTSTDTPISFDVILSAAAPGSAITHVNNSSDFTCLSAGIVSFEYSLLFDTNATGYRQTSVRKGPSYSASEQYSNFFSSPAGGGGNYVTIAGLGVVPLTTANVTLRLYGWQNSGVTLAVTTAADAGRNVATVRYIAPDPDTNQIITLALDY